MIEISEIIEIIIRTSNYIYSIVSLVLFASAFVGRLLVSELIVIFEYAKQLLDLVGVLLQITYEDLTVFFQDIRDNYNLLSNSISNAISHVGDRLVYALKFFNSILLVVNGFLQAVTNLGSIVKSFLCFVVRGIDLIGTKIWMAVVETPRAIACEVVDVLANLLDGVKLLYLNITENVISVVQTFSKFMLNFPYQSLLGFIVGVIAIYCAGRNARKMFRMAVRITGRFLRGLKSLCTSLWTGNFSERRRHAFQADRNDFDAGLRFPEDKLCVACQDRHKEVLLFPCKHICLCLECSALVTENQNICPICRTFIRTTMRVYI